MSSVSNGLYFLTLPLVSFIRVIYRKIRHARYLHIKRNVEKFWGARYTLGALYLSKNTVDALIAQICFWNKTLHDSDSFSGHHQEFFTVQIAMVYVIQVCCVYSEELLMMARGTVRNM